MQRVLGALGSMAISGVFSGAAWMSGFATVASLLAVIGAVFVLLFLFASERVLKFVGMFW
jgi:hypothetical protein